MARNGTVNLQELEAFRQKMEQNLSGDRLQAFIESCAKELAARLLAKVIKRTPVGKKPEIKGDKFVKVNVKGADGKERVRKYLSSEGARLETYWGGYKGGTLRRGWTAKTHEEAESGQGSGKPAHEYAQSLKIKRSGSKYTIEIINPVKYAPYVEYGHRQEVGRYVPALGKRLKNGWVQGKFMLTLSEQEIKNEAPRILENKLKKLLGECFE